MKQELIQCEEGMKILYLKKEGEGSETSNV